MGIRKEGLSCAEARRIDMVGFLAALGFQPAKVRGNDFWYCSPLRNERTASFKVNRSLNRWYDFGTGQGGSLIDFGMLYYQCDLQAFLLLLGNDLSFPRAVMPLLSKGLPPAPKLIVTSHDHLNTPALIHYLQQRRIALAVALHYCCEVRYMINERAYFGIGFKNDSGGYEIRNPRFKGSSSPKDITLIKNGCNRLCVLEGFIDFLSWLTLFPPFQNQYDFLILNSLALFEKATPLMEAYQLIHLYLDNNPAGKKVSSYALSLSPKYRNQDQLFRGYEDLNDFLCQKPLPETPDSRPP